MSFKMNAEIDVFISNYTLVDSDIFQQWIEGYSSSEASFYLKQKCFGQFMGAHVDLIVSDILDQYRSYSLLERLLHAPIKLSEQSPFQLDSQTRTFIIEKYYSIDDSVAREILGKKLSSRYRKDLDEVSEKTFVKLKSCRRQFDNVKRIFKTVEEMPGNLTNNIKQHFMLSDDLAKWRGGGVGILIRRSIQHKLLPCIQTNYIENIGIEVTLRNNRRTKQRFKNYLTKLFNMSCKFLIGGDLNCRHRDWGCVRANSWENVLSDFTVTSPISVKFPPSPTYVPTSSRGSLTVMDLYVTNVTGLISQPVVFSGLNSDHNPVLCKLRWSGVEKVQYFSDIKNANWAKFRKELKGKLLTIPTNIEAIASKPDFGTNLQLFTDYIDISASTSIPQKCLR